MNTSIKTRAAALVASILVTFASVYVVADYAYPEAPASLLASAAR
jgi:archaellum component FlaF (FlaF/FlaG flagellin family)